MSRDNPSRPERLLADISAFDCAECLECWREVFGRPPPNYLSSKLIKRVLIWEARNRMPDGVSTRTTRRLQKIVRGKSVPTMAKPGSHLVREWNERTYQLEVINGGLFMDGKSWRSLSAIARHISGPH